MNANQHEPTYSQEDLAATGPWSVHHTAPWLVVIKDVFGRIVTHVDGVTAQNNRDTLAFHIASIPDYDELLGLVIAGEFKLAEALAFRITERVYT